MGRAKRGQQLLGVELLQRAGPADSAGRAQPQPPGWRDAQALIVVRNAVADPTDNATTVRITENGQPVGPCAIARSAATRSAMSDQRRGGDHTLRICADADNEQVEINEENNCTELQFSVEDVDDYEPDNRAQATLIRDNAPQDHTLHNAEDIDYLFFVVNRPSEAQMRPAPAKRATPSTARALLDAKGRELTSNNNGGEGNWCLIRELQPATYCIRVNREEMTPSSYRINLRLDLRRPPRPSPRRERGAEQPLRRATLTVSTTVSNAGNAGVSQATIARLALAATTPVSASSQRLQPGRRRARSTWLGASPQVT